MRRSLMNGNPQNKLRVPQQVMPLKSEIANYKSPKSDLLKY
jgi:hypothetical protein